jgi:hypothetical protein
MVALTDLEKINLIGSLVSIGAAVASFVFLF